MELAHCAADFWREKEKELKLSKNKNGWNKNEKRKRNETRTREIRTSDQGTWQARTLEAGNFWGTRKEKWKIWQGAPREKRGRGRKIPMESENADPQYYGTASFG
jgi:hypothetical protein